MVVLKYLFIFALFSIVGWILELVYRSLITKKIVNPGFMSGCVVPLYGFGAIIINILCTFFNNMSFNYGVIFIFLLSMIFLSMLEFISGYILFRFFNLRLWDYSGHKYNVKGFICLDFSLIWGFLALIFFELIFPWINDFSLAFLNNRFCFFCLGVFYGVFSIDLSISIDLLKKMKEYSNTVKEIINLEKLKIDSIRVSGRKKIWKVIYPYISTNRFLKDKIKK